MRISRNMQYIGLVLLAVVTLTAVIGVLNRPFQSQPVAATTATSTPTPTEEPTPEQPLAVFIGDSYTAGFGSEGEPWTTQVAEAMGWTEENLARGGTGYVQTSGMNGCGRETCPNYLGMLDEAKDANPDVIVISGGQNDFTQYQDNPDKVLDAVAETYIKYREAFPKAEIIAVGPSTPNPVGEAATNMDAAVQDVAANIDAQYVSLLEPDVIEPSMVLDDGAHVGPDGHAAIADRVLQAIR